VRAAVRNGHIKRITDDDIASSVLEIVSANVSTTYVTCPSDPQKTLGIKLPFLVMIIKNLKKYFSFEVQVLDDKNVRRRFRASNYQVRLRTPSRVCGCRLVHWPLSPPTLAREAPLCLTPRDCRARALLHPRPRKSPPASPAPQYTPVICTAPPCASLHDCPHAHGLHACSMRAVHHPREALHLHHAHAPGRRLEPDPVQPGGLHAARIRCA